MNDRTEIPRRARAIALLVLALTGCTEAPDTAQSSPADDTASASATHERLSGLVSMRGAQPVLVPCSTTDTVGIEDAEGRLAKLRAAFARDGNQDTFALLWVDPRNGTPALREVLYASGASSDCFRDWSGYDLRALGNEPGWVLEINGRHIKLQRQGGATTEWPDATPSADSLRLTASNAEGKSIEVRIDKRDCTDSMSGAYYARAVRVLVGGETLEGCGLRFPAAAVK